MSSGPCESAADGTAGRMGVNAVQPRALILLVGGRGLGVRLPCNEIKIPCHKSLHGPYQGVGTVLPGLINQQLVLEQPGRYLVNGSETPVIGRGEAQGLYHLA